MNYIRVQRIRELGSAFPAMSVFHWRKKVSWPDIRLLDLCRFW